MIEISVVGDGVRAVLENNTQQAIVALELSVVRIGEDGQSRTEAARGYQGIRWEPGRTMPVTFEVAAGSVKGLRVVPRALVLADGTGHGDPQVLARYRSNARQQHDGIVGVLQVLETFGEPSTEPMLQSLIENLALSSVRLPTAPVSEAVFQSYTQTMVYLMRLRGREIVGTARFTREFDGLRARLNEQLAQIRRAPEMRGQP